MKGEVCVSGKPQKPATQTGHYDHYGSHVWKRDTGCAVGKFARMNFCLYEPC